MCRFVFLCLFTSRMIYDGLIKDAIIMAVIIDDVVCLRFLIFKFLIKNCSSWRTYS